MTTKPNNQKETKTTSQEDRYFEAVGRRKTSTARVRLFNKKIGITVNNKDYKDYFKTNRQNIAVTSPLKLMNIEDEMGATVKVSGGGLSSQAEAIRHGLSRALVKYDEEFRKKIKRSGFLTRDARMVERKKYGLKKARRAPQWSKR